MKRTSPSQFTIMVEFMERHGDLSALSGSAQNRLRAQELWEQLTRYLNADGSGSQRERVQWMKVWADYKNKVKSKAGKILNSQRQTGGGPALRLQLTDTESRLLAIYGQELVVGTSTTECGLPIESLPLFDDGHHGTSNEVTDQQMGDPEHEVVIIEIGDEQTALQSQSVYGDVVPDVRSQSPPVSQTPVPARSSAAAGGSSAAAGGSSAAAGGFSAAAGGSSTPGRGRSAAAGGSSTPAGGRSAVPDSMAGVTGSMRDSMAGPIPRGQRRQQLRRQTHTALTEQLLAIQRQYVDLQTTINNNAHAREVMVLDFERRRLEIAAQQAANESRRLELQSEQLNESRRTNEMLKPLIEAITKYLHK